MFYSSNNSKCELQRECVVVRQQRHHRDVCEMLVIVVWLTAEAFYTLCSSSLSISVCHVARCQQRIFVCLCHLCHRLKYSL